MEVLPELLKMAGIQKCILVGHSDGGSIAIIYAGGTNATPLLGLITEAAHLFCEKKTVLSIRKAGRMFRKGGLRRKLRKYHGDNVESAFWGWHNVWLQPGFMHWNLEEYLRKIKVPILAIQGKDDEYGSFAQAELIAGKPGAEALMLNDCGHNPHKEQPEATLRAIKNFIRRINMAEKPFAAK